MINMPFIFLRGNWMERGLSIGRNETRLARWKQHDGEATNFSPRAGGLLLPETRTLR
jgi:hypothetical protein